MIAAEAQRGSRLSNKRLQQSIARLVKALEKELASLDKDYRRHERLPYTWNHVIEKESLNFKELEHVRIEKVEQLFRDVLTVRGSPAGPRERRPSRVRALCR